MLEESHFYLTKAANILGLSSKVQRILLAPHRVAKVEIVIEGGDGKSILSVNGQVVAKGHIPKTQPFAFSTDECVDIGSNNETMVFDGYKLGATDFNGEIVKATGTVAQL